MFVMFDASLSVGDCRRRKYSRRQLSICIFFLSFAGIVQMLDVLLL